MATHIQVSNYADFKSLWTAMHTFATSPGQVFYQPIAATGLVYAWWYSGDGNWVLSNCPPAVGSAAFTGFNPADFTPTAVVITTAGAPAGAGQVATPGLILQ
jgi:hypothetical protein